MNFCGLINCITALLCDSRVQIFIAFILAALLFINLIIYIATHTQKSSTPLKKLFIAMFALGMVFYCYCHYCVLERAAGGELKNQYLAWVGDDYAPYFYIPYVVMRSVIDVGMMFYGRGNSDVFYSTPISENPLIVLLFWLINMIAFFTTAGALLIRFGNGLLRWIRINFSDFSDVALIFGITPDSLTFGRNITGDKGGKLKDGILVYVDNFRSEDYDTSIRELGGLVYSDNEALRAAQSFLQKLHVKPHETKFRLYALSSDSDKNLQYAHMMSESLKSAGITPEQTELVLLGTEEEKGMMFQADNKNNKYGYGSVVSFDEYEIAARLLIHEYPLCDAINFDEDGRATEDMHVLIVGFGRIGHEVLRKVVANGQFEGSHFHATIYDPNIHNRTGFFMSQYHEVKNQYDIKFEPQNGRSSQIFQFISDNAAKLKYIVICLKDRDTARDIAIRMVDRFRALDCPKNVYTCDAKGIRCYSPNADECTTRWIYDSELLYSDELDRYAMELNHHYMNGDDKYSDWRNCDYFGRMSSRAAVDYLIPLISKIKNNNENLTHEQRENISKSEHLRWCAFHYTFGFSAMSREEFAERLRVWAGEMEKIMESGGTGKPKFKPGRDYDGMRHICLTGWDELDEISDMENAVTHGGVNYKENDRNNVDTVMGLIKD